MEQCLGWMPMTLASCRAARASWVPPGCPCCAPGGHHLVPTTHSGHNQPAKGHLGGDREGDRTSRAECGRGKRDREVMEERKRMQKRGGRRESREQSENTHWNPELVFPPRSRPVLAKSFSVFNEFWLPSPCRPRRRWNISKSRREGAARGAWK